MAHASSLSRDRENFVVVGTPVKLRDRETKPLKETDVRDEFGRRRFHGAFTGGFSAGYYNTVGSKEGWKPSEFRSSARKDKRESGFLGSEERQHFAVADFLDDEDLRDGIGSRLATKSNFDFATSVPSSSLGMTLLAKLIDETEVTVGTRKRKVYGPSMPKQMELFAAADFSTLPIAPTTGHRGLGCSSPAMERVSTTNAPEKVGFGEVSHPDDLGIESDGDDASTVGQKGSLGMPAKGVDVEQGSCNSSLSIESFVMSKDNARDFLPWYPPPHVPDDFVGNPMHIHEENVNQIAREGASRNRRSVGKLTASERGSILEGTRSTVSERSPATMKGIDVQSQPSSTSLSARFVSGGMLASAKEGTSRSAQGDSSSTSVPCAPAFKRITVPWVPARLLCKRMNVMPPYAPGDEPFILGESGNHSLLSTGRPGTESTSSPSDVDYVRRSDRGPEHGEPTEFRSTLDSVGERASREALADVFDVAD